MGGGGGRTFKVKHTLDLCSEIQLNLLMDLTIYRRYRTQQKISKKWLLQYRYRYVSTGTLSLESFLTQKNFISQHHLPLNKLKIDVSWFSWCPTWRPPRDTWAWCCWWARRAAWQSLCPGPLWGWWPGAPPSASQWCRTARPAHTQPPAHAYRYAAPPTWHRLIHSKWIMETVLLEILNWRKTPLFWLRSYRVLGF